MCLVSSDKIIVLVDAPSHAYEVWEDVSKKQYVDLPILYIGGQRFLSPSSNQTINRKDEFGRD